MVGKVIEIRDKKEVDIILQRLNFTEDLKRSEIELVLSHASYVDKEFIEELGNDTESYDLINVYDLNDEVIITFEDKRMCDEVSVLELNEDII